jgi:hypothetical protein
MKKFLDISNITQSEKKVISDWSDGSRCKIIRSYYYGNDVPDWAKEEVLILENMFTKYDSNLNKNETIYRGLRFDKAKADDVEIFNFIILNAHNAMNNGDIVSIDDAPSSFSRVRDVAFYEFGWADKNTHHTIIFELVKRQSNELDILPEITKYPHQKEIIIRSQNAKYKILTTEEDTDSRNYDTITIKIEEV